jgi:hypothetical protein
VPPFHKNNIQTLTLNRKHNQPPSYTAASTKNHKLFQDINIKIAFCKQITIQKALRPHTQTDKYITSGIYQMKCRDCQLKYRGQIAKTFNTRYKERIQAIRNNNSNSKYPKQILNQLITSCWKANDSESRHMNFKIVPSTYEIS